jgi:GT2 family glycosyltransferase
VLLTCFNRREKTLGTLRSLETQSARIKRKPHVILVDDGSRDGTAEAVLAGFPATELIRGSGSLFWNGGMRVAFGRAQEIGFDYYLLLNDDTVLVPDCLDTLLETSQKLAGQGISAIVAASTCDPVTGKRTYGGTRRLLRWNGVKYIRLEPLPDREQRCDTMNGNCVLIPAPVAERLGNLEATFSQQFGDYDYGSRYLGRPRRVHRAGLPGHLYKQPCGRNLARYERALSHPLAANDVCQGSTVRGMVSVFAPALRLSMAALLSFPVHQGPARFLSWPGRQARAAAGAGGG